jgi:HAD superfamily hydrolase (TIGR01484 family)
MRYFALACDYDGTIARHGEVDAATLAALERLRSSGRKLILVTGRQLEDLMRVFPHVHLFERVVVENGAVLYRPATREEELLGESPPEVLVQALRDRDVDPLSVGRVIVATWEPHQTTVLDVIHELGVERQLIFNKGAVMVLPSGVNKATGLLAALREMRLSPHNVVGVGDAENDHAFLGVCECAVAVANALPALKERADLVTKADRGAGVTELIDQLVADDFGELGARLHRHDLLLGTRPDGEEVRLKPYGSSILVAGTSGSGKSTLATGFLECLSQRGYQFCIIDPEGDYQHLEGAVTLGDGERAPTVSEVLELLGAPDQNGVVNLLGLPLHDRPSFFDQLFAALLGLRSRTGRPHWIVIDEAHHLLPPSWAPATVTAPQQLHGMMLITVHPDHVARVALSSVDLIVAVGESPERPLRAFAEALDQPPPAVAASDLARGEAVAWWRGAGVDPFRFHGVRPRSERRRHLRKYAEGELGTDKSFYFRGADGKLKLRAQNLMLFLQLADGVDDDTWMHHLRRGEYSRWFRDAIKDEPLAAEAERIESAAETTPEESRAAIRSAVEERYTGPA